MVLKVTKAAFLFIVFNILIYFVHSSIGSLGKVDLLTTDFKKSVKEKQLQYGHALKESLDSENSEKFSIRKCCKKFDALSDGFQCVQKTDQANFDFFPKHMMVDKNFSRVSVDLSSINIEVFGTENECRDQIILLKDNDPLYNFIMVETGELVQMNESKMLSYSKNYCLDVMENNHQRYFVLMLCPCRENLCFNKCCPLGEYFNVLTNKCTKNTLGEKYVKLRYNDNDVRIFLMNRQLNCSDKPNELINNINERNNVLVRNNGSLLLNLKEKEMFIEWDSYCVDVFSDGKSKSETNGFYCKKGHIERMEHDVSFNDLNKCCKDGESLNQYFKCQKIQENKTGRRLPPKFMIDAIAKSKYKNFSVSDENLRIELKMEDYAEQSHKLHRKKLYIRDILETYDSSLFCIDAYQGKDSDYGVIFTPCEKNLCLQKCCPSGQYFNVKLDGCVKDNKRSKQNIALKTFKGLTELNHTDDYFLVYSESRCFNFERQLYMNSIGHSKLLIQEHGMIVKQKEKYKNYIWENALGYCVDIFSDENIGLVNGFYCNKNKTKQGRNHFEYRHGFVFPHSDNSSASIYFARKYFNFMYFKIALTLLILHGL